MAPAARGRARWACFGGTFDPIHNGHLRTAFELLQALKLAELRFMPTGNPPHREHTQADAEQRLAMVRAAVADQPGFTVDDREVRRTGLSYSVDTLHRAARANSRVGRCACCWAWMPSWACPTGTAGSEILELAHVVVAHRPGWKAPTQGPAGRSHGRSRHRQPSATCTAPVPAGSTSTP